MPTVDQAIVSLMDRHPDKVEQAQGNPALVGWFVGQVMKALDGNADPRFVSERVTTHLHLTMPMDRPTPRVVQ